MATSIVLTTDKHVQGLGGKRKSKIANQTRLFGCEAYPEVAGRRKTNCGN
jgi:hypothetical protein